MNFGRVTTAPCVNVPAPPDTRCDDPGFAILNPGVCPSTQSLIIKPAVALTCQLSSIQFGAFTTINGTEVDVTASTIFTTSDPNIAVVGAISGNATGMSAGDVVITGTYLGMTAQAELTVLGDTECVGGRCVAHVGIMVVVDTSKSMSLAFSSGYSTRLSYAKAAATRFISEINASKDQVGLMVFNDPDDTVLEPISSDITAVGAAVAGITQTQNKTAFVEALNTAITELNDASVDRRVIVLISDGEDSSDPGLGLVTEAVNLANDFKQQGGIIICLGCRASGSGYSLLSALATGGFFLNGYPAVQDTTLDYLSGLKGYICAGNCIPAGDHYTYEGALDYDSFINWDVIDGKVDLIGKDFIDILPGNGLYVDMSGSSAPWNGVLRSKVTYALTSGHVYRFSVSLAGNQRWDPLHPPPAWAGQDLTQTTKLQVYDSGGGNVLLSQVVSLDWKQNFTDYSFSFTAPANMNVYLSIDQSVSPLPCAAGMLLDRVSFDDMTDLSQLLYDDFDHENPVYVPPACGVGTTWVWLPNLAQYGYATGQDCYGGYGCLSEPPAAQLPDPNPLANVEANYTPPVTYTSTRQACASCATGTDNVPENLIPVMTSATTPSGEASASTEASAANPAWKAFTGVSGDSWIAVSSGFPPVTDFPQWLRYSFDAAVIVTSWSVDVFWSSVVYPQTVKFQGSNDGTTWTDLDSRIVSPTDTQPYAITTPGSYLHYRLYIYGTNAPFGQPMIVWVLKLTMFGTTAPTQVCKTATATSTSSQQDADNKAYAAALLLAQAELNCQTVYSATEHYTASCDFGLFAVSRSATATSLISQADASAKALAAAKYDAETSLDCDQSNNNLAMQIPAQLAANQEGPGSPYPSTKLVSGLTGTITSVKLVLTGFNHQFSSDVQLVLISPTGTKVMVLQACGDGSTTGGAINLNLFDAAASSMPAGPPSGIHLTAGDFKPTQYGSPVDMYAPCPAGPYGTAMSDFVGEDPNGHWYLFAADVEPLDLGVLAGWDLTITTA
jgi:hypothetical protein